MKKVWLQDFRSPEVEDLINSGNDIILIPVGSVEQHGRHLPIGTDAYVGIKLAEDAARKAGVVLAPPLWFGWSDHHMGHKGTITLKAQTLITVVEEICVSLIKHGFRKLLIINGHRITNLSPLAIAAMNVKMQTGAFLSVIDPAVIGATIGKELRNSEIGGLGHGDELETSHILYLYPDLVDMGAAARIIPKHESPFMELDFYAGGDKVFWTFDMEELSEGTGGFGDPTSASREKGEEYHLRVVEHICRFIETVRKIKVESRTR
jgi:creatinine amidohydrolase